MRSLSSWKLRECISPVLLLIALGSDKCLPMIPMGIVWKSLRDGEDREPTPGTFKRHNPIRPFLFSHRRWPARATFRSCSFPASRLHCLEGQTSRCSRETLPRNSDFSCESRKKGRSLFEKRYTVCLVGKISWLRRLGPRQHWRGWVSFAAPSILCRFFAFTGLLQTP